MDVGVAIGDETLHTIEQVAAVLLGVGGFQHHTLQVGTGIGLGEVHRHGLAGANARDVLHALLLVAEFIQGVDARLQRPNVLEAGIGAGHHLAQHGENSDGQVQATVTARHGNAPEAALSAGIEVLHSLGGIDHAAILQMRTFEVDTLGVGFNDVGGDVARDVEHTTVVLHRVFVIDGSVCIVFLVRKIAFLQFDDALHQRVVEVELQVRVVVIIICHFVLLCLWVFVFRFVLFPSFHIDKIYHP